MSSQTNGVTPNRLWNAQDLAAYLRLSIQWVYKRTQDSSVDPPPRCPGIRRLRFNPRDPKFRAWLERQVGAIDFEHAAIYTEPNGKQDTSL
jgi:hypothetical protein